MLTSYEVNEEGRERLPCRSAAVVEIVAVKALWNRSEPKLSTALPQRIQLKAFIFTQFQ
jgi:hypothetical protein